MRRARKRGDGGGREEDTVRKTIKLTGMHCPKCDARVEKAVGAVAGVESVRADHEADEVEVVYDGAPKTLAAVKAVIAAQDFAVEG